MQNWIIQIMNSFGFAGIFLLILLENLFPPIPSEVILTFGGFMTTYTNLHVLDVILASTAGSTVGAALLYYVGRKIPRKKLEAMLDGKVGRWLHFERDQVEGAMAWFEKKGRKAVFFCRCVPIIRSLISIPAGMAQMNLKSFLVLTALGSFIWNSVLVSAGAFAGASWEKVLAVMDTYSLLTVLAIGALTFIACTVYYGKKDRGQE